MKRRFCCDSSRQMYIDHYSTQQGYGMPIFQGHRGQRGHGLGSMFAAFARTALPILKRGLSFFGREALRTGAKIATDVADGKDLRNSARQRIGERINDFVPGLINQNGSGSRKRRSGVKRSKKSKRRRRDYIKPHHVKRQLKNKNKKKRKTVKRRIIRSIFD
jgi:hypothetical protein